MPKHKTPDNKKAQRDGWAWEGLCAGVTLRNVEKVPIKTHHVN
ncbi:hypothetical protein [Pseudomonas sp. T8]|nr:hypothetical protein [Pseudomonas sp. T8]UUT22135.1 hypothetical protein NRG23_31350 [Pseudomonas sp. T8]